MIALRWASFSAIGSPSELGYSIGATAGAGRIIARFLRAGATARTTLPRYHTPRRRSTSGLRAEVEARAVPTVRGCHR